MKKHLHLVLGSALALGGVQQASAQLLGVGMSAAGAAAGIIGSRKAAKKEAAAPAATAPEATTEAAPAAPAPVATASVQLVELDLTAHGMPLLLQVPAGTTVKKSKYGGQVLQGPDGFLLDLDEKNSAYEKPAEALATDKERIPDAEEGAKMLVDEPLAYHYRSDGTDDRFMVIVENPGTAKFYTISPGIMMDDLSHQFGEATNTVMFAAAHSAKLTAAAKAVKPFVAIAPKAVVRNAAGETDLSSFGLPVVLKVPAGTTAESGSPGRVELKGPDFAMRINLETGGEAKLRENIAGAKDMLKKSGYTLVTNEPLALMAKAPKAGEDNLWMVVLPDAATGKTYMLEQHAPLRGDNKYGPVKTQAMFAAAKAARVKK